MSTSTSIAIHGSTNGHKIRSPARSYLQFTVYMAQWYSKSQIILQPSRSALSSSLPPSVLPPPAAAGAPFGPSLGRTCSGSRGNRRSGHGRAGLGYVGRSWGWYGPRGLEGNPLRCLLLLLTPRVHRLNEQAANRARCDEEDPFGDARDEVVDFG